MVLTFEWAFERAQNTPHGRADDMTAASATLPPGAYTTFRTYPGNRVLRLRQHAERLVESAALMAPANSISPDAARSDALPTEVLRAAVAQVLQSARAEQWAAPERRFRVTFAPPRLFISIEPFTPYPAHWYDEGVTCVSVSMHRDNPQAKSTGFIASAAQAYRALPSGVNEGLMIAADGAILEGLSSNFFAVLAAPAGLSLHTEQQRVLLGVTRSLVLEVAGKILPISTQAARIEALHNGQIREAFITSVSREILPVVQIDQHRIGDGTPGPITRQLVQGFAELVAREAEPL